MKFYNINWVAGSEYILRDGDRWTGSGLIKVKLISVNERTLEFVRIDGPKGYGPFLKMKSDFSAWGKWEMIERI